MSGGRLRRPPLINYQFQTPKNMKNMQKCVKIYKDGGAKIFQKSQVNQPNQGHQPWQSNSLTHGGTPHTWALGYLQKPMENLHYIHWTSGPRRVKSQQSIFYQYSTRGGGIIYTLYLQVMYICMFYLIMLYAYLCRMCIIHVCKACEPFNSYTVRIKQPIYI